MTFLSPVQRQEADELLKQAGIAAMPLGDQYQYILDVQGYESQAARFYFQPRPDQPERYDQQTSFYNCHTRGVTWLLGGNGAGTTELAMAKVAKCVYETPAPRFDTPFWIIAESYEQTMETCWKEKLYGHGHILDADIDWGRVEWYRSKAGLPYRVPLKPLNGEKGKNWLLEFKSWNQGRGQMQARAIGGFCFVEQFPWDVFQEVSRGCRVYNFPGSKICEYTPVDPTMSLEIEEMIQNGPEPEKGSGVKKDPNKLYLNRDWNVFHANTECAMEAGHVDREWFEEFFGMIPDAMRDVRMKGLFASFEGVIYKTFSPFVHVIGDEIFDRIVDCWHRRSIDWGSGLENPFGCLWGARSSHGQWFIYDEYYSNNQEFTTIDHLAEVHKKHSWDNSPLFGMTYCDPASPGYLRIAQKMGQITHGKIPNFSVRPASNRVIEGIEHIMYALKPQIPVTQEDGTVKLEPRLLIHEGCRNLIREIKGYRWLRSGDPTRSLNPTNARPEPLKRDDHLCDALRYLLFTDDGMEGINIEAAARGSKQRNSGTVEGFGGGRWRDMMRGSE